MKLRMNQAIALALAEAMREDERVFLLGEDIADAGGVFKATEGLVDEFGPRRVRNTPISEMGFLGAAVGAAATGLRPVVEIMFMEFLGVALDQLSTQAAKFRFLSAGKYPVPLVVRASVGAGLGFGAQHSQTLEGWVCASPGLKVAMPSGAQRAYGVLRAAIGDDDPVIVLEPRALYGTREEVVADGGISCAVGRGQTRRRGADATIVATGQMVERALAAADQLAPAFDLEVIDPVWLIPWDVALIEDSVRRTGRLAIVEEAPQTGSWGNIVAAHAASALFGDLAAPVLRVSSPDTPIPFPAALEGRWLPDVDYLVAQVRAWLADDLLPAPWWAELGELAVG